MNNRRKVLISIFVCFLILNFTYTQKRVEIGVNSGVSVYYGDINESRLFYSPNFYQGGLIKYNFDERYALRLAVKKITLHGNDLDFNNFYQKNRENLFESKLWDVVLQTEFNFLPYNPLERKKEFMSPYVTAGFGMAYVLNNGDFILTIPFGVGLKVKINKRIGIGSEWSFRKTFSDGLDNNLESIISEEKKSLIHNNDWYSVLGIFLTYNISKLRIECPAYK